MLPAVDSLSAFRIPLSDALYGEAMHWTRRWWRWLGRIESDSLREKLDAISIDRPIYIAGLARSGSTILLEMIAAQPGIVTHQYRDFWAIHTPYWSEQVNRLFRRRDTDARVRSHGDGILVTPDSPEAIEEMLWMDSFCGIHDPTRSNVLSADVSHPRFESDYRDHVRKLLLARNGNRYASKANYHVARLEYLIKLFPDVRVLLPVRRPREHVASLMKQHRLLCRAADRHPRSVTYLDRVGHFEFGKHRRPIHLGDDARVNDILQCWRSGDEVRGWARYWAMVHGYLHGLLRKNEDLRTHVHVVRYEDLCEHSEITLQGIVDHCELSSGKELVARCAERLQAPTYYAPTFTPDEERAIAEETEDVAATFGYPRDDRMRGVGIINSAATT